MTFEGVLPVLQTPFQADGELDADSLAREVDHVARAGANAVVFPGFAGEWWKLSEEEIFTAAAVIARCRTPELRLIFNITAQSTFHAVRQARRFAALGADGLMCLPPFVVHPDAAGMAAHLRAVLAAADVPHAIQYAASLTGTHLSAGLIADLAKEFPHLRAIKVDFIPPGPAITSLRQALHNDSLTFVVGFAGLQIFDAIQRGARGLMGAAGHVAEDVCVFRALLQGGERSGELYRRLAINKSLYKSLPYDPEKDFEPLSLIGKLPNVLVVNPKAIPVKTVSEFIDFVKARPGQVSFSSIGNGSSQHLAALLFQRITNTKMVHVPYRSSPGLIVDLVSGQVPTSFQNIPNIISQLGSGEIRAIAVASRERTLALPNTPTMIEQGVPDFESFLWLGLLAPKGTPKPITDRLYTEISKVMSDPAVRKRMIEIGVDPVQSTPDELRAFISAEVAKWRTVISEAGVTRIE